MVESQRFVCTIFMHKVKQDLPCNKQRRPRGVDLRLYSFLTSALDGDWWLSSRPCHFNPLKETRYPFYKRLLVPRDRLDECGKTHPHRDSIAGPSNPYRVAIPTDLSWPIMPVHKGSYSHSKTNKFTFLKMFAPLLLFMSPTCFGHFFYHPQGIVKQGYK